MQDHGRVWRGLLEADRLSRYYGLIAERFRDKYRYAMWSIAVVSFALTALGFGSAMRAFDGNIKLAIVWGSVFTAFLVGAVALWVSYADYSRKAGLAASISHQCEELTHEWEDLWYDLYAEDAPARTRDLARRMTRIAATARYEGGFVDDALNAECTGDAYSYWLGALSTYTPEGSYPHVTEVNSDEE